MPTKPIKLSDLVRVGSRFGRSVNLERDFYEQSSLEGYVLTSTARSTLHRLAQSLTDASSPRAWTLTGPYGSGKSAFALFTAKILSADKSAGVEAARNAVRTEDESLWQKLFDQRRATALRGRGFCPVLISGSREPIQTALLRGLERAIKHFWPVNPPLLLAEVGALLSASERGEAIPARSVVEAFEQASQKVCSSRNPGAGLLIIIDEFGKLLEHAAAHPDDSDIFVLQELAETAKRSIAHPILLVTILHQAYDRYFDRLARAQKEEWMKVQGRFEDVAFQEPIEQLLRTLACAIEPAGSKQAIESLRRHGRELAQKAIELRLTPRWMRRRDALELLEGCAPLHPTVALALGHVFHRLAQNERSLFAFLTSQEPFGFREFLAGTEWDEQRPVTLRADCLYDYIATAFGSGLYARGNGRAWAEIESALNRLADPTELEVRLIKTIGLLNAIGDIGCLKPSRPMLRFALADKAVKPKDTDRALAHLEKRSVIIYRKYRDAFSFWEGSDIVIEARLKEARAQIDPNEPVAHSLSRDFKPKPVVARRHSFRTGTLRFFEARYADLHEFENALDQPLGDADGLILYAIASSRDEIIALAEKAGSLTGDNDPQALIAVPQEMTGLKEAVSEISCLKWVWNNTPELEGDRAARKEIRARLAEAESSLEKSLRSAINASGSKGCAWYRNGARVEIRSERAIQEHLSEICDEAFSRSPVLHNELINRRHLSSSAAAARRELVRAMLAHSDKKALGIEGYPPQLSIYFSLLEETGMHREENGRWGFFPPKAEADSGTIATWKAIAEFFAETEVKRRSIAELFDLLARPPYGIKSGPLPILLCAALLHYDTEIALYEQGSFIPSLSLDVFERLMKSPDRFEAQRCRIAGVRAAVFERFANVLLQKPERALAEKPNVIAVVRLVFNRMDA